MLSTRNKLERRRNALGALILVLARTMSHSDHLGIERKQMLDTQLLIDTVASVMVHNLDAVKLTCNIAVTDVVGNHARVFQTRVCREAFKLHDDVSPAGEILAWLAAACDDLALDAFIAPFANNAFALTVNVHVEAAGETAVGRDGDHKTTLGLFMHGEHRIVRRDAGIGCHREHDIGKRRLVGLSLMRAIERATDLGRRDHLHRARDLLGARDRGDSLLDVAKVSHRA